MEDLIGDVFTPEDSDKSYLATSMRQLGDKYLFFMSALGESMEMMVADVRIKDEEVRMKKYTGSDYDEIFSDFFINLENDLKCIRTKLLMKEAQ